MNRRTLWLSIRVITVVALAAVAGAVAQAPAPLCLAHAFAAATGCFRWSADPRQKAPGFRAGTPI